MSHFTAAPVIFSDCWNNMLSLLWKASMSLLLYGIFFVLFIFAIHTLSSHHTHGKSILIAATWVMFVVGTTVLVLYLAQTALSVYAVQESTQNPTGLNSVRRVLFVLGLAQRALFTLNALVADLLFVWRCYVIWGKRKDIVVLPGALVAATTGVSVGYFVTLRESGSFDTTSAVDPRVPFVIGIFTNLLLMALTAGRIWWIRQQARRICGRENIFDRRYGMALTLILESGALYCLVAVLVAIFQSPNSPMVARALLDAIASQGVNIFPTLMVVRVGLGHNIQDTIQDIARPPSGKLGLPVEQKFALNFP
ncbi:hypothetical protein B0H13DRAFT_2279919 [Mycena leptocephala]|nr:hypothetical protein B0H13DRAFT_2279919 [Mycena leptocephala]